MTVDIPQPRIVGVELHGHTGLASNQHSVAQSSGNAAIVDCDYFKTVPMKMHGMRHGRFVDELNSNPLTLAHVNLCLLLAGIVHIKRRTIDEPVVLSHVAS